MVQEQALPHLLIKKQISQNSSRAFKLSEQELAIARDIEVIPIVFAVDALCIVVNESLEIDSLNLEQIKYIYEGKITNWSYFGAQDMAISLYGRQGNSGTYTFIQKHIVKGDYSLDMKQMNGTSQIMESIKKDPAGIGYVGVGYVMNKSGEIREGIKVLHIQETAQSRAISPTETQNIYNGTYPIIRPLFQYLSGRPQGKLRDFILYELSSEGQKIISENGYFPIFDTYKNTNNQYLYDEQSPDR